MTEYPHDPDFPFLVVTTDEKQIAKFRSKFLAEGYRRISKTGAVWEIIDTTPKPRIPVDALYITWVWANKQKFAIRDRELFWDTNGFRFTENELLEEIGDTEITVLDPRKEES